jgi:CRISPR-associated endonuclease/helicase Cas3
MQPAIWPEWLDDVWAKSPNKGEKQGESLATHTWLVLSRLADLQRLRPDLPQLVDVPKLWHYMFWTCLLHDFGKAAQGFQHMLRGGGRWPQRHEVLSLAFVEWIAAGLSLEEQRWIVAGIVSHHRDAKKIDELYHDLADPDPLVDMVAELAPEVVDGLWRWLDECAPAWMRALALDTAGATMLPLQNRADAGIRIERHGAASARTRLQQYRRLVTKLAQPTHGSFVTFLTLLRGLTTSADHMASAHLDRMPPPAQEEWRSLAMRIRQKASLEAAYEDAYQHQRESALVTGSAQLVAPTGSAKTESALYWALGDGAKPVSRLFYALPYQASMNAMYDRLNDEHKGFGEETVGLQHGRAVQAMYARWLDGDTSDTWAANAAGKARWERNINTLNARPIKVFSPYQMLKAMFQLRGFEAMLTDYVGASFVFDEIHAYEPSRLALILAFIKYLREQYGARFFVMSATFPSLITRQLADALGSYTYIEADATIFERFRRHRLKLLDGDVLENGIPRIVHDVREGKQVLVCVNTVRRAQEVYAALGKAGLSDDQLLLIHSRYIYRDRNIKESAIRDLCGVDVPLDQRRPLALIATQVVEVSLNIDLSTIYSDPAPLEALLQRFGRVNRQCKRGICPVHVFREPSDGQGVYGRHKDKDQQGHIVRVTLAELEQHNDTEIDEAAINSWLDRIYADPQLHRQWEDEYQQVAQNAASMLDSLRPFNSDDTKEEQFEKLFDGVEIVPKQFEADYINHITADEFIEASNYLVSISKQKFAIIRDKGLIQPAESDGKRVAWVARLTYDADQGLHFPTKNDDVDGS